MKQSPINPNVSLVNKSSMSNADLAKLCVALQKQVDRDVAPAWGVGCELAIRTKIKPGEWGIVLVNEPDAPGALGYHDLTKDGLPLGKVFVEFTRRNGENPTVTTSHELLEMLIDPAVQMLALGPKDVIYAYEVCDACQDHEYTINGVQVSNFVYPTWFESFRQKGTRFDYLGKISKPFGIAAGGYMPIFKDGEWTQIFGSSYGYANYACKPHPRGQRRGRAPRKSRAG